MQFVYQALTWGFLLALVPLLIHLINMMRHRRVQWAAMEFLLQSYKKHRRWVWLKQMLLLLSRMAVIALIVAMLAQLKTRDQWLNIFGGQVTHHYVLLDDSYSMSDRVAGASALDAAKQVVTSIVNRAGSEDSQQKLTLVRFSQARASDSGQNADVADFNAEPLDASFDLELERKTRGFDVTQLAVGPQGALGLLKELLNQARDETSIVYLLSDFRAKDWGTPTDLRETLQELKREKADIHFINCSRSQQPNLGIVEIAPTEDTRAAGVPLFVNVKVKNFGLRGASKVQLKLQSTFYPPEDAAKSSPEKLKGQEEDLATLLIDNLGPGETIVRRVQVYFPQAGRHVVKATLPEDPVEADNHRYCVIEFPEGEKALVVDGSVDQQNAYFMEIAFRPLEKSNTGVRPDVKPVSFLRDATAETLAGYSAIYLLDVDRLDARAVETLEKYVRGGGGLAIFSGPNTNLDFYNRLLYRDGQGLLPLPLGFETQLPPVIEENTPDMELKSHPIFSFFVNQTNPLIRGVKIDRFRKVAEAWKPDPENPVGILATLRDNSPLIAEKKFGEGQVIEFLSTLAPEWNDWAKNPSFVVVLLKLQSYLASTQRLDDPRLVGTPLRIELEAARYRPDVTFIVPSEKAGNRVKIDRIAAPLAEGDATLVAAIGVGETAGKVSRDTDRAGIYEAWPMRTNGDIDVRRWAFNVDPAEGDLTTVSAQDLLARLDPVKVSFHQADQYQQEEVTASGYNLSYILLAALVALMLFEQLLAYSASYHPTALASAGGAR